MSRTAKPFRDMVREWARTASREEIDAVHSELSTALFYRDFGVTSAPLEPKRGRPPGSRNRAKDQDAAASATQIAAD